MSLPRIVLYLRVSPLPQPPYLLASTATRRPPCCSRFSLLSISCVVAPPHGLLPRASTDPMPPSLLTSMASRKQTLPRVVLSSPHHLLSPFRICATTAGVAGVGRPRNPDAGGRRVKQRTTVKALRQHLMLALQYFFPIFQPGADYSPRLL
jgi:hypothetical protein